MTKSAVIFGFEGQALTANEISFFKEVSPWGFIIFARNIDTPDQVRRLTDHLKDLSGETNLPVLVDQEGGRVARFRSPHWRDAPPTAVFGKLYGEDKEKALEASHLNARLLAHDLLAMGVSVDCLPMLDVRAEGSNDVVIGDRAYSNDPEVIAILGRAAADGLLCGGVLPVIKHLPGHGRALIDSHEGLPVVAASMEELEACDFRPFHSLADLPLGMTGHLIFTAIDKDTPSTLSRTLIEDVIRSQAPGRIGFDGLLMTDDLSMGALSLPFAERTKMALQAGCDMILHCNGEMAEMTAIASQVPLLAGKSLERAGAAINAFQAPDDFDADVGRNRLQSLVMGN